MSRITYKIAERMGETHIWDVLITCHDPKGEICLTPCSTTTSTSHPHISSSSLTLLLCGSSSGANLVHKFSTKLLILLLHNVLLVQQVQPLQHGIRRPPELMQGGKGANRSPSVVLYNLKTRCAFQALAIFNMCL